MSLVAAPPLPNLHDVVLIAITLDWAAQRCDIELCTAAGPGRLQLHGVRRLASTHLARWGPSAQALHWTLTGTHHQVQMQSGDGIELEADGWTWIPDPIP